MSSPTRQKLMDAAFTRFYRDGFRNVGIDQILSDVGISKTAFYKHFESKEDLLVAALEDHDAKDGGRIPRAHPQARRRLAPGTAAGRCSTPSKTSSSRPSFAAACSSTRRSNSRCRTSRLTSRPPKASPPLSKWSAISPRSGRRRSSRPGPGTDADHGRGVCDASRQRQPRHDRHRPPPGRTGDRPAHSVGLAAPFTGYRYRDSPSDTSLAFLCAACGPRPEPF